MSRQRRLRGHRRQWRALGELAERLAAAQRDELDVAGILAILGRALGATGIALASPGAAGARPLAHWGRVPRAWSADGGLSLGDETRWQSWPLTARDGEYGQLWVRRGRWEAASESHGLLAAACQLLAAALRAQSILRQEHHQRVLAETLQHVSQALTSTLDIEEVLARILDELARLVPYDSANVMLLEDGVLRLHAQRGYDLLWGPGSLNGVTFTPEQTPLTTDVLYGERPVILADAQALPGWIWVAGGRHIRSWMGVPLRAHDRVIGMFSIDKAQPGFFTPQHTALAAALAPHAAVAIENARLFRQVKAAEAQLRGLSARVIDAQEAERQRIGRELHDHAGQALLALRAELQVLAGQIPPEAATAHTQLSKIDKIVRAAGHELRLLSHDLRSHLLDELGLGPALEQHVREFGERFSIEASLIVEGVPMGRRARAVELAAFRIAQEALTNVARHAQAAQVVVRLAHLDGGLRLAVEDDGVGFEPEACGEARCFGLLGMRERAAALHGTLTVWSKPGQGSRVVAEFPKPPVPTDMSDDGSA